MLQETREAPSKDNEFTRELCRVSLAAARRRGFDTKHIYILYAFS